MQYSNSVELRELLGLSSISTIQKNTLETAKETNILGDADEFAVSFDERRKNLNLPAPAEEIASSKEDGAD